MLELRKNRYGCESEDEYFKISDKSIRFECGYVGNNGVFEHNSENIAEFMGKCKFWAIKNGFSIETKPYDNGDTVEWMVCIWDSSKGTKIKSKLFDTEVEGVIYMSEIIFKIV